MVDPLYFLSREQSKQCCRPWVFNKRYFVSLLPRPNNKNTPKPVSPNIMTGPELIRWCRVLKIWPESRFLCNKTTSLISLSRCLWSRWVADLCVYIHQVSFARSRAPGVCYNTTLNCIKNELNSAHLNKRAGARVREREDSLRASGSFCLLPMVIIFYVPK